MWISIPLLSHNYHLIYQRGFEAFRDVRLNRVLKRRREAGATGVLAFFGVAATVATGGLVAPLAAPLIVGGCASSFGMEVAGAAISGRDRLVWNRRLEACRRLRRRFP